MFPLTRLGIDAYSNDNDEDDQIVREVWFRGFHSDVGGGNNNEGLSNIPSIGLSVIDNSDTVSDDKFQ